MACLFLHFCKNNDFALNDNKIKPKHMLYTKISLQNMLVLEISKYGYPPIMKKHHLCQYYTCLMGKIYFMEKKDG